MLRVTRVALSVAGAALLLGACGGSPMYSEQKVPTVSVTPPSTPSPQSTTSEPSPPTSSSADSPTTPPRSTSTTPPKKPSTTARPPGSASPSTTRKPTTPSGTAAPSTSAPSASSTPAASPTTLDTLGGPGSGPISIAGTRYQHSFAVSACTVFSTQPSYDFALGGRYRQLSGVVGQDDGSASREAVLRLIVRGDGRTLANHTVRYGQRIPLTVDVSGVRTLTLDFSEVGCGSDGAALAFGQASVK